MTSEITVAITPPVVDIQPCAPQVESHLFEAVAQNLMTQGYSVHPNALPESLGEMLHTHLHTLPNRQFDPAGIGRVDQHTLETTIRKDEICWITGDSPATQAWLDWTSELQIYLNRRLFLGLFSFESHFAHYAPGDFYKRHLDAFHGDTNRILSVVVYLNRDWKDENGGELVLYKDQEDTTGQKIKPSFGTIVTFLSEEFPHEVLPAHCDRYSIAGWFRVNSTCSERVDPPK